MNNLAHSQFRVSKQAAVRARAWYQISKQAAAPREPALRRLLKQALVNKWNPGKAPASALGLLCCAAAPYTQQVQYPPRVLHGTARHGTARGTVPITASLLIHPRVLSTLRLRPSTHHARYRPAAPTPAAWAVGGRGGGRGHVRRPCEQHGPSSKEDEVVEVEKPAPTRGAAVCPAAAARQAP